MAERIRALRVRQEWSQEELADRLGIDRRQVVRLETGRAPVTLEVIEALSLALGVPAVVFMFSTMEDQQTLETSDMGGLAMRSAQEEWSLRYGAAVERPGVSWLVRTVAMLPDESVRMLGEIADAFLKARLVSDEDLEEDNLFILRPIRLDRRTDTRARRGTRQRARRPAGGGLRPKAVPRKRRSPTEPPAR